MLLRIPQFLSPQEVASLRQRIDGLPAEAGSATGNPQLKHNLQLNGNNPAIRPLIEELHRRLIGNQQLVSFALPKTLTITINRYEPGMYYHFHSDAAIMGGPGDPQPIRTDLSFTLALSEPEEYDGGEFHLRTGYGETVLKEAAGSLICYPSNMPHRVETITRGQRICAIGWIQSIVRGSDERAVMLQLWQLHGAVTGGDPAHQQDQAFGQLRNNLLRLWAEH
ncbi:MAG: Fe2+-dependent dioxygenase [Rhodospirillales bacterium]